MIDTKLELAKALDTYIKEKHTQEECTGFIDGFEKADALFAKRIVSRCVCKIPDPAIKVSENGVSAYCRKCAKTYIQT